MDPCRIFAGNASRRLAQSICDQLQVPLGDADVGRFEDGEVSVRFNENIRGSDVFVIQATGAPADNLMELLVMLDAAKRASARRRGGQRECRRSPGSERYAGPCTAPGRRRRR